jgi:hypothetical protein
MTPAPWRSACLGEGGWDLAPSPYLHDHNERHPGGLDDGSPFRVGTAGACVRHGPDETTSGGEVVVRPKGVAPLASCSEGTCAPACRDGGSGRKRKVHHRGAGDHELVRAAWITA